MSVAGCTDCRTSCSIHELRAEHQSKITQESKTLMAEKVETLAEQQAYIGATRAADYTVSVYG